MSPDPRRNPAAFENVGAAVSVVAANAPSSARREMLVEQSFVMVKRRPVASCLAAVLCGTCLCHPQMHGFYCTSFPRDQRRFLSNFRKSRAIGKKLLNVSKLWQLRKDPMRGYITEGDASPSDGNVIRQIFTLPVTV
ncbi:hypothetical protein ACSSNL_12660 [Thalassobius sp. S69A]|uniref:hypothetical protein n=1 Tax=unclassified Thalassovita TaxID=2619711 RepID=UPI003C7E6D9A